MFWQITAWAKFVLKWRDCVPVQTCTDGLSPYDACILCTYLFLYFYPGKEWLPIYLFPFTFKFHNNENGLELYYLLFNLFEPPTPHPTPIFLTLRKAALQQLYDVDGGVNLMLSVGTDQDRY